MNFLARLLLVCLLLGPAGCTTMQGEWGSRASLTPGWDRVRQSARDAATSPHTWGPLLGAALFSIGDFDEQTADWATDKNPLFGSVRDAAEASDDLKDLSQLNYGVSVIAVPSRTLGDKFKGLAFGIAAREMTGFTTSKLKSLTARERPAGLGDDSFPSNHASTSTVYATLAAHHVEAMPLSPRIRRIWQWTSYSIGGLTAWARVEGQRHYPSDVLAGYALGYFFGAFVNDAFIEPVAGDKAALQVEAGPGGEMLVNFRMKF